MPAGGVVHGDDQIPHLAGDPLMPTAVLVQHHAGQRGTLSPFPMRPSPGRPGRRIVRLQQVLDPGVAALALMAAAIPDVKVPHIPALVPVPVQLDHGHDLIHRRPPMRDLGQSLVEQALKAFFLVAIDVPPKRPLAHPQQSCGFLLAQPAPSPASIRLLKPHHPGLLSPLRPSHSHLLRSGYENRTDHVLQPRTDYVLATQPHLALAPRLGDVYYKASLILQSRRAPGRNNVMKRIMLFLAVNVLVVVTIGIVTSVLGIRPYITQYGID